LLEGDELVEVEEVARVDFGAEYLRRWSEERVMGPFDWLRGSSVVCTRRPRRLFQADCFLNRR
jgi:hypothetical protein